MLFSNRALIITGMFVIALAVSSKVDMPLPDGVNKSNTIIGRIRSCDIKAYGGRYGKSFLFVGINLQANDTPYLRWNTDKKKRNEVERMCQEFRQIKVVYTAKRTLLRPTVTFWIDALSDMQHNN